MRNILTEEKIQEIREYYLKKPITLEKMSRIFGFCTPTIRKALGPGIKIYDKNRIYNPNLDEDFFQEIDNEYKAYFLGLIIADGNVYDPNDTSHSTRHPGSKWVSITLHDYDQYMLGIFKHIIKLSSNVASDGRGSSYVAVRSTKMANDLQKYGIVQRKSFITKFPFNVSPDMYRHIIRGIIDGDGSIDAFQTNVRNKFRHRITCCGTHRLMQEMIDVIVNGAELDFTPKVYDYKNKLLSEFRVTSINDMYKLGKWMYMDCHVFLERKYETFQKFVRHYGMEPVNAKCVIKQMTQGSIATEDT